jgi:hypothetical protein
MKSVFKTNLDLKQCENFGVVHGWVPRVGEYVCSQYTHSSGVVLRLEVYEVTYYTSITDSHSYALVELHLPKNGSLGKNISEFEKKYNNW